MAEAAEAEDAEDEAGEDEGFLDDERNHEWREGRCGVAVLPCLGEHAVVPEDGAVVVAQLALLHVLSDRIRRLLRRHLRLIYKRLWWMSGVGLHANFALRRAQRKARLCP